MMGSVLWVAPLTITGPRGALAAECSTTKGWGRGYLHEPITTYFADCTCVATGNNINLSKMVDGRKKPLPVEIDQAKIYYS
jgi:hypothetical protein